MAFSVKDWQDDPSTRTPLSAAALEDMEKRLSDYSDAVAKVLTDLLAASGKGFVNHGSTAGTARPSGYASVEWIGSVEPTNATDDDTWIDTSTPGDLAETIAAASTISPADSTVVAAITGTTLIRVINGGWDGRVLYLRFSAATRLADNDSDAGSNLQLTGALTLTADDIVALVYDAGFWYEISKVDN